MHLQVYALLKNSCNLLGPSWSHNYNDSASLAWLHVPTNGGWLVLACGFISTSWYHKFDSSVYSLICSLVHQVKSILFSLSEYFLEHPNYLSQHAMDMHAIVLFSYANSLLV